MPMIRNVMNSDTAWRFLSIKKDENQILSQSLWFDGIISLQKALHLAVCETWNPPLASQCKAPVRAQRYPLPEMPEKWTRVEKIMRINMYTTFVTMLPAILYMVRSLLLDKETKLRQHLHMLGIKWWHIWTAHAIFMIPKMLLPTVLLHVGVLEEFPKSSPMLVMLVTIPATIAFLGFAVLMSSLSSRTTTAFPVTIFFWTFLHIHAVFQNANTSSGWSGLHLLNFLAAYRNALERIGNHEMVSGGATFGNLFKAPSGIYTVGTMLIVLLVDGVLLIVAGLYVDAIWPGDGHRNKLPWFLCSKSFWTPPEQQEELPEIGHGYGDIVVLEEPTPNEKVIIRVVELERKGPVRWIDRAWEKLTWCPGQDETDELSAPEQSLEKLSMKIMENEITVFLGENGCGKSQLFEVLAGLVPASSGTAYIKGIDVQERREDVQNLISYCPQFNIFIETMTVMENLKFFHLLKGVEMNEGVTETRLKRLGLESDVKKNVMKLSAGQQRKLSLLIALIGDPEILLLDMPTTRMDVVSRHEVWDLLKMEKQNRTILMTTDHPEEADFLADRVAIMESGTVRCFTTPATLIDTYQVGFRITVTYSDKTLEGARKTLKLIKDHFGKGQRIGLTNKDATFFLVKGKREKYANFFEILEKKMRDLNISSYKTSIGTVEEAYLKMVYLNKTSNPDDEENDNKNVFMRDLTDLYHHYVDMILTRDIFQELVINCQIARLNSHCVHRLKQSRRVWSQTKGLLIERMIYQMRRWMETLLLFMLPTLMMCFISTCLYAGQMSFGYTDTLPISSMPYKFGNWHRLDLTVSGINKEYPGEVINVAMSALNTNAQPKTVAFVKTVYGKKTKVNWLSNSISDREMKEHLIKTKRSADLHLKTMAISFPNKVFYDPLVATSLSAVLILRDSLMLDMDIRAYLQPLNLKKKHNWNELKPVKSHLDYLKEQGFMISFLLISSLLLASTVTFDIRVRQKKFRSMEMICGASARVIVIVNLTFEWILLMMRFLPALLIVLKDDVLTRDSISFFLSFLVYSVSGVLNTSLLAKMMSDPATGFCLIFFYNLFSGLAAVGTHLEHGVAMGGKLFFVFFSPTYGLIHIWNGAMKNVIAVKTVQTAYHKGNILFLMDGHFVEFLVMISAVPVNFALVYLFSYNYHLLPFQYIRRKAAERSETETTFNDQSVKTERDKCAKSTSSTDSENADVLIKDVKKSYGRGIIVKGVSLHVSRSTCLCLIGPDCSGKTTLLRTLAGDTPPTSGSILIHGHKSGSRAIKKDNLIGYCPQYDYVLPELTGEETLYLIARLRGIRAEDLASHVRTICQLASIQKCAKVIIKNMSAVHRRRLSFAMAIVGLPKVMIFDQPTAGLDIHARTVFRCVLENLRSDYFTIIVATECMKDVEAFADRVAVMQDGVLRTVGTVEDLKMRYGQNYTLIVKTTSPEAVKKAIASVLKQMPEAILKEQHAFEATLEIPAYGRPYSQMFMEFEKLKKENRWKNFVLNKEDMDQIFYDLVTDPTLPPATTVTTPDGKKNNKESKKPTKKTIGKKQINQQSSNSATPTGSPDKQEPRGMQMRKKSSSAEKESKRSTGSSELDEMRAQSTQNSGVYEGD